MQSVGQGPQEIGLNDMVPAAELRDLTATPEDLFDAKKLDTLTSLMSSMVGVATKNGSHVYQARFTADYDTKVLDAVQEELRNLGYNVNYEPSKFTMEGRDMDIILLTVSWEAQ